MSCFMRLLFPLLIAAGFSPAVNGEILVGGFGDTTTPQPLLTFSDTANGNVAPVQVLGGAATGFSTPIAGSYEPQENVIYVADFYGQAVRVFALGAHGDVAPKRIISGGYVSQVRSVVVDAAHDEMLITSGCCFKVFDRNASGDTFFKRYVQWGGLTGSVTQQNSPTSLVYLPATDEVAEVDIDNVTPYTPKLLVFNRTDSGNVAPKRIIQGANTQFGKYASALGHDASSRKLFVAAFSENADLSHSARILVFDDMASGNVAPERTIAGFFTGLELASTASISGLAIDAQQQLIVTVSDYANAASNKILVFPLGASGNTPPTRVISGSSTGFPKSLGAAFWAPDRIFRNGFE